MAHFSAASSEFSASRLAILSSARVTGVPRWYQEKSRPLTGIDALRIRTWGRTEARYSSGVLNTTAGSRRASSEDLPVSQGRGSPMS